MLYILVLIDCDEFEENSSQSIELGEIIFKFFCLKLLKKIDIVKVFDNIIMVLLEEFLFSDVIIIEWLIKVI